MGKQIVKASASASSGIGFAGMLTITFIVLKLLKIINWSWWWVTAPLWIGAILLFIIVTVFAIIIIIAANR